MRKPNISGGLLVFLGAAFWSLNSPFVKFLQLDFLLICGLRSAIAALALAAFIRPQKLRWNGWMLLYVCSYAALCLSIILALTMTSAPVAIGMQYTSTLWLFLLGLLSSKKFQLRAFIPVGVIFIGVVFFMCSGATAAGRTGNLIALSEGIFFACMTVSAQKAAGTNPVGLTAIANIFTAALMFLLFPSVSANIPAMTRLDWGMMLILGIVQVGGGYAFYNLGLQKVSAQRASILALWEMILGPVWVALFLREYPGPLVLAGFMLIIAGLLLDSRLNHYNIRRQVSQS